MFDCSNTQYHENRKTATIIGLGPVGRSVGWALYQAGYPVTSLVDTIPAKLRAIKRQFSSASTGTKVKVISSQTKIFVLSVPDDQITSVADQLAALEFLNKECIAIHCSGALEAEVMSPLRRHDVRLMSFHPMISFARNSRRRSLKGVFIGIEGDDDAVDIGYNIARDIGAIPTRIPTEMKIIYHLAGVWASNFLVGLMTQALSLMEQTGHDPKTSWLILEPLIKGTLDQIKRLGVENALTGPAMRGDAGTIKRHLEKLADDNPELLSIYKQYTEYLIKHLVQTKTPSHKDILKQIAD